MNDTTIYDVGRNIECAMLKYSDNDAIYVEGTTYSYASMYEAADRIRHTINENLKEESQFVGLMCYRSFSAYAGLTGVLLSKNAFLPLNPLFPVEKLSKMVLSAKCKVLILADEAVDVFMELAPLIPKLTIICPKPTDRLRHLKKQFPNNQFIFPEVFAEKSKPRSNVKKNAPAYMMFTSGSTGEPKGIMVSHKNLHSYVNYMVEKYEFDCRDRISQAPDISFDLSIHDICTAFYSGGCLCVLPKEVLTFPHKFINDLQLTAWLSVPSIGMFMDDQKLLLPGSLPTLRLSFFCGEGLPTKLATNWKKAAINSRVINCYGPTEATIMCTSHEWELGKEANNSFNGLVSIGKPFDKMEMKIVDNGMEVNTGDVGELYLHGDQVVDGYYRDSILTKEKFVTLSKRDQRTWYRTGDLVKKDDKENYFFVGRIDDQMQIRGNRVEMLAIDSVLRDAVGHSMVVSIPVMSKNTNIAEDIVAFSAKSDPSIDEEKIIRICRENLPNYMVPSKIYFVNELPINQNGKINKKILFDKVNEKKNEKSENEKNDYICSICLKDLNEDKKLSGLGLIKIINHDGEDKFVCHTCLRGY